MLLVTETTLNLESFIGTIMAIGVAVANAILLVSFAEPVARHVGVPDQKDSGCERSDASADEKSARPIVGREVVP